MHGETVKFTVQESYIQNKIKYNKTVSYYNGCRKLQISKQLGWSVLPYLFHKSWCLHILQLFLQNMILKCTTTV